MIAGISSARTAKVSSRTPTATVTPTWISFLERQQRQRREGPRQDQPGTGDDAAGVLSSATSIPARVPRAAASSRARVIRKML